MFGVNSGLFVIICVCFACNDYKKGLISLMFDTDDDSSATGQRRVQSGPKERTPRFIENSDAGAVG